MSSTIAAFALLLGTSGFLPSTSSVAASELREASALIEGGHPREALARLGPPDGLAGYADPLRGWLAARAFEATGAPDRALAALGSALEPRCVPSADDHPRLARAELAARLLAERDPDAAARRLGALETPEAWSAALALARGPLRAELERRLLVRGAGSPEAAARFLELGPEGVLDRFAALDEKIVLAEAWLDAHDNRRAVALARRLREPAEDEPGARCRVGYVLGKAARNLRAYGRASARLGATREDCFASSKAAEGPLRELLRDRAIRSALLEARVLAIRGRSRELDGVVAWMRAHFPGHSYIDDAALWAAEAKDGEAAQAALRAALALDGDQAPGAAWRIAFDAFREGRPKEAAALLAKIPKMAEADLDDEERAEHFLGLLEARTSTAAAAERWARLARHPGFYGFLALARLGEVDATRAAALRDALRRAGRAPSPPLSSRVREHPAVRRALLWHRAGFPAWAEAELRAAACGLENQRPEDTLGLALVLNAIGAHPPAQRILRWDRRRLLDAPLTDETAALWRAAYSLAFTEEIRAAAEAEKVEPLLLTALAREESTFDPEIVSWAGATGLAQLMPATAIGAYADVHGGRLEEARLLEPALNLRLGAHVLREGLEAFGGVEPMALSAYNGGAGLTRRTLPAGPVPFEVWAESNPVKENRGYVKRVMGTWGTYRLLYDPEHAGPRLPRTVGPGADVSYFD